jgi:type IV secretory pathway VirJ component
MIRLCMKPKIKSALIAIVIGVTTMVSWKIWQRIPHVAKDPDLGAVHIYPAWLRQRGMVFLFSGAKGWTDLDESAAWRYARDGNYVAGIDTSSFLAIHQKDKGCVYLPGMIEGFSTNQQDKANTHNYQEPVILGHDEGATLVYMAHLQAQPLALAAAAGLNPQPQIELRSAFCDHKASGINGDSQTIAIEPHNPDVPLRMWNDSQASAASKSLVAAIAAPATVFTVPDSSLYAAYQFALNDIAAERLKNGIADLPVVEVKPAKATTNYYAIIYSGDGGWRDLDQTLAGILADKGVPVVGVDVLRYYWHSQSPKLGATDLARIMRYYDTQWQRNKVVLIGFSFGGNVLPFLYNRLPDDLRSQVQLVSLLSPERTTAFEVDPKNWLGMETDKGRVAIEPELKQLPSGIVQCIYGADEQSDSLCTLPTAAPTHVLRKTGGHHFDENYDKLADDILALVNSLPQNQSAKQ